MKNEMISCAIAAAALVGFLSASPAQAQATRTWVSGVGDDVNPCSRTAPCKTFAGAISKTAVGGEINCLDPGGFGGVTITKSITISCEAGTAGVLVSGTNGITINDSGSGTPGTAVVFLKGLDIEGTGTGLKGISFVSGGFLHVENCVIRNFNAAAPNGLGIAITNGSTAKFAIVNSTLTHNGNAGAGSGGGILVQPTSGSAAGTIDGVTVDLGVFGIVVDGNGGGSAVNVTVRNSNISNNSSDGILAQTGAVVVFVMVDRAAVSNNNGVGTHASGAGATIRVGSSSITGNATGTAGALVLTYQNNQLNGNGFDGSFGGPVTPAPPLH